MIALVLSAFAQDVSNADSLSFYWASLRNLEAHPELIRPLEEPLRFKDGIGEVELTDGFLIPIFSGRFASEWERKAQRLARSEQLAGLSEIPGPDDRGSKDFVGFVWVGSGTMTVELPDRADALAFANHMVRRGKHDRDAFAPIAKGDAPFQTTLSEGMVLSIDPAYEQLFLGDSAGDPFEITVFGLSDEAKAAQRRARPLLRQRTAWLDDNDVDVADWMAWDRIGEERGELGPHGPHLVLDFDTGHDYRYGLQGDTWLTVLRDDTGTLDRRRRCSVYARGRVGDAVLVGGEPFPPLDPEDPRSTPTAPVRMEPQSAKATLYVQLDSNALTLDADMRTRLTLKAVGGPAHWFDLEIPRTEARPGTFELVSARLADGTPLIGSTPLLDDFTRDKNDDDRSKEARDRDRTRRKRKERQRDPNPGPEPQPAPVPEPGPQGELVELDKARVRLFLPELLRPGETIEVVLHVRDTWPYANWAACGGAILDRPNGKSSGLQGYLPGLANGQAGRPWRFEVKVGVPQSSPLTASVSGLTRKEWEDGTWRWVQASHTASAAMWPDVAVGKWDNRYEPAAKGFPSVRTHLFTKPKDVIDSFGPEVRRVLGYYQRWLPPYPYQELEIFEAPSTCGGFVWIAPHAMINISQMVVPWGELGDPTLGTGTSIEWTKPHLESAVFAHEIAHQYWGHVARPGNIDDFWIAETFAEGYSCMYVGAAFKPKDCQVRMRANRRFFEDSAMDVTRTSLTGAYRSPLQPEIVYQYGPYVFHEMLRRRLGREAYFAALDLLLREHNEEPVTTEHLQYYLEGTSKRDLSDYFDFWVHGGQIPALTLTMEPDGDGVVGTITSDVPFGTFDVPVHLGLDPEDPEVVWVDVIDGVGTFRLDAAPERVRLDPDGLVLARSRKVR